MGLFGSAKADKNIFLTNEDYPLSRLRHAIVGSWIHEYEIKTFPSTYGLFSNSGKTQKFKTTLKDCTCDDRTEDGVLIRPCVHMYKLALETGQFETLVKNPEVENIVRNMRTPLFNNFCDGVVSRGYYREPHKWGLSKKTFNELMELGLIKGKPEQYDVTAFFLDNAAAWIYYTATDPRAKVG